MDEVAKKLRQFLPIPDGTTPRPYIFRFGRNNYDYRDLSDVSLHHLALMFDDQVFNPTVNGALRLLNPSIQALAALVNKACIFLCTNSTAAGPMLSKLGVSQSLLIIDEAAHASEVQPLMSILTNVRLSQQGRVHVVLVGDQAQLGPVLSSSHTPLDFVRSNRLFTLLTSMRRHLESLFNRLH